MEGCATSVTETLTLPAQPATGSVFRIPLGGDGFTAPIAAYSIKGFNLVGDAGGNNVEQIVIMDDRFCSLISWVTLRNVQATELDADVILKVSGSQTPAQMFHELVVASAVAISTTTIVKTFIPTPFVLPGGPAVGNFSTRVLNVLADVVSVDALIYLFDITVREKTPMGPLLWSRGAT